MGFLRVTEAWESQSPTEAEAKITRMGFVTQHCRSAIR